MLRRRLLVLVCVLLGSWPVHGHSHTADVLAAAKTTAGAAAGASEGGCGHGLILETEQRLVTKSLFLRALSQAKESYRLGGGSSSTSAMPQPLPASPRVSLSYQLAGFASLPAAAADIQTRLMPTAVKVLQKLFQLARPTAGNLQLPSGWGSSRCIEAEVEPGLVAGKGPGRAGVDYVLFVTSAACLPGTMAYAGVCAVGGADVGSRPIMGAINLCPGAFERLPARRQMETVIHELLHAFVFSPALFPLFRGGDPRTNVSSAYGPAAAIASPAVVAALRRLSNCSSATAAALEDEGDAGSRGSHWETRLFQGELMLAAAPFTGRTDKVPRLGLTAALLQDSGWYLPRWEVVPPLDFGAAAGCGWLSGRAKSFMAAQPQQRLYCAAAGGGTANGTTCTYDSQAVAECFKVAADASAGGSANFLNGVGFPYARGGSSNCLTAGAKAAGTWSALGTWQGSSSLCYPVQRLADSSGKRFAGGAACWDTTCDEGGKLWVILHFPEGANQLLRCPTGRSIDLAAALPKHFASGMLQCPNNAVVCAATADSCGRCVHGYCQGGTCHCGLEWLGLACDVHVSDVADMDAWFERPQQEQRQQHTLGGNRSSSSSEVSAAAGSATVLPSSASVESRVAGSAGASTDANGRIIADDAAEPAGGFWAQPAGSAQQLTLSAGWSGSRGGSGSDQQLLATATEPVVSSSVSSSLLAALGSASPSSSSSSIGQAALANQPLDALFASLTSVVEPVETGSTAAAGFATSSSGATRQAAAPATSLAEHQQALMQQLMQAAISSDSAGSGTGVLAVTAAPQAATGAPLKVRSAATADVPAATAKAARSNPAAAEAAAAVKVTKIVPVAGHATNAAVASKPQSATAWVQLR